MKLKWRVNAQSTGSRLKSKKNKKGGVSIGKTLNKVSIIQSGDWDSG
jgi:hypothetical protein